MQKQVIGIVGMGPVGTILAAYLNRSGVEVYGVDVVESRAEQVNRDGLRVRGYANIDAHVQQCFTTLEELAQIKDLSGLFLCTKTWAIKQMMQEFVKLKWPTDMRLVAFMNGIGPEDTIGEYINKDIICRGIVNYAGNINSDGVATMNWFHPPNILGPATERDPNWMLTVQGLLSEVGLETILENHYNMKKAAFFKTILNSALNALCSAHGLTMAQALRLKHTLRNARILLREGLSVAGLVGYNYGEDALDLCLEYLRGGGSHYPSMWFDLKNRRPTEIEYINGKIVKIGQMFKNVDVDLNMYFTSAIITQEIKNGTRDEEDIPDYLIHS